jgi:hypothetical protein
MSRGGLSSASLNYVLSPDTGPNRNYGPDMLNRKNTKEVGKKLVKHHARSGLLKAVVKKSYLA